MACRCCGRVIVVQATVDLAERVRAAHYPHGLVVRSWYRCPKRNAAVGGAKDSLHMRGLAVDVDPVMTPEQARACGAGGVGIDHLGRVVHVDTGPERTWHYDAAGHVIA